MSDESAKPVWTRLLTSRMRTTQGAVAAYGVTFLAGALLSCPNPDPALAIYLPMFPMGLAFLFGLKNAEVALLLPGWLLYGVLITIGIRRRYFLILLVFAIVIILNAAGCRDGFMKVGH